MSAVGSPPAVSPRDESDSDDADIRPIAEEKLQSVSLVETNPQALQDRAEARARLQEQAKLEARSHSTCS